MGKTARLRLRASCLFAALLAASLFVAAAAQAKTIDVQRGQSVAKALKTAQNGDVIRIHPGTYRGKLVVDKGVTLTGVGKQRPVIDARCKANDTILVTHAGATIERLQVQGAATNFGQYPAEVQFLSVTSGSATHLRTVDTCDAQYGISAFSTGPVKVTHNFGKGFDDSAIYIGTILDTLGGTLLVADNRTVHNSRGIIIEDSPKKTDIVVRKNVMNRNTLPGDEGPSDGLYLHNSQGIDVIDNTADRNGNAGFHADLNSGKNRFVDNVARHNGSKPFVDDDEGAGNCGSGNSFHLPGC
ncbi:MAG: hypothetical protein QOJ01_2485 [Solirubrobacterales bacterium]|nr:hypothetical protein [Solirubrobacterales bacterium]